VTLEGARITLLKNAIGDSSKRDLWYLFHPRKRAPRQRERTLGNANASLPSNESRSHGRSVHASPPT
jgi:hypothetical protein